MRKPYWEKRGNPLHSFFTLMMMSFFGSEKYDDISALDFPSPASPWHLLSDYKLFKQKVLFPSVLKRYFGIKSRRNEKKMVCLYIKKYMYELSVFSQSQSNIRFNECLRSKSFSILATESMSLKRFCFVLRIKETKTVGV